MDIQTIKLLQQQRAAITLVIDTEVTRTTHTQYSVYAIFEISDLTSKKLIPARVWVDSNRSRNVLIRRLTDASLSFIETPFAGAASGTSPEFCSPEPKQCQRLCSLCGKTDLDFSAGCYNPSNFSGCVGDWVCNVNLELS